MMKKKIVTIITAILAAAMIMTTGPVNAYAEEGADLEIFSVEEGEVMEEDLSSYEEEPYIEVIESEDLLEDEGTEPDLPVEEEYEVTADGVGLTGEFEGFLYEINDGDDKTATITGYKGLGKGDLSIPGIIVNDDDEYTVTAIGDGAFMDKTGFNGIIELPDSVISIGKNAFKSCINLKGDLILPGSVTTVGENAFYSCSGIYGTLLIPAGLTAIGDNAFYRANARIIINASDIEIDVAKIGKFQYPDTYYVDSADGTKATIIGKGEYVYRYFPFDKAGDIPQDGGSVLVENVGPNWGDFIKKTYGFTPSSTDKYRVSFSQYDDKDPGEPKLQIWDDAADVFYSDDQQTVHDDPIRSFSMEANRTYYFIVSNRTIKTSFYMKVEKDTEWSGICEEADENEYTLSDPQEVSILNGEDVWYMFSPQTSGNYFIYSGDGDENSDPEVHVYSVSGKELCHSASSGDGNNFFTEQSLKEGSKYYFRCGSKNASDGYTLNIVPAISYINGKNPGTLAMGSSAVVSSTSGNRRQLLEFTTGSAGEYSFYSYGAKEAYAGLYDFEGKNVCKITGSDDDFSFSKRLPGGRKYYLMVYSLCGSDITVFAVNRSGADLAEKIKNSTLLVKSTANPVTYEGEESYFKYKPDESGRYTVYTDGGAKPYVDMLSRSNFTRVDGLGGDDKAFSVDLKRNTTYYFKAYSRVEAASYPDEYDLYIVPWAEYMEDDGIAPPIDDDGLDVEFNTLYEEKWFKFKPNDSTVYDLYSKGGKKLEAKLYNSAYELVAEGTSDAGNFVVSAGLEDGKTYYLWTTTTYEDKDHKTKETFTVNAARLDDIAGPIKAAADKNVLKTASSVEVKSPDKDMYFKYKSTFTGRHVVFSSSGERFDISLLNDDLISSAKTTCILPENEHKAGTNAIILSMDLVAGETYYFKTHGLRAEKYGFAVAPWINYFDIVAVPVISGGSWIMAGGYEDSFFKFIPQVTGEYTIYSETGYKCDPRLIVYLSDGRQLYHAEDELEYRGDFSLTERFTEGTVYYLYNNSGMLTEGRIYIVNNNPVSIKNAGITLDATEYKYNGKACEPQATVKIGNRTLKEGRDYTLSYDNNIGPGTAYVTVKGKGDYKDTKKVSFRIVKEQKDDPVEPESIKLSKSEAYVLEGEKLQLTATVLPKGAKTKVTWSSSDETVAKVSSKGKVTAKAPGTAVITAGTTNGKKAKCKIKVPGMTLNNTKLTVKKGKTSSKIKVSLVNDSINSVKSNDTKIAKVERDGKKLKIKGIKEGKTSIRVTSKHKLTVTLKVTVQKDKVTTKKLTLEKSQVTLSKKGKKTSVRVTATPDSLSTGEKIKAKSDNKKVATAEYDIKTGKVVIKATGKGKCKIKVSAGKVSRTISVKVKK